ncbi:MAG: 16S rRNA (cytosine(1402)-N(4))-methyltransferase RsmH [Candidatus Acetothermia bacterium]
MNEENGGSNLHVPVMVGQVLEYLDVEHKPDGTFLDATTSTGGHSRAVAEEMSGDGELICLDVDRMALRTAKDRLEGTPPRVALYQANFSEIDRVLEIEGGVRLDGILFDLGFSSFQIDDPERGFSFQKEGPLDMRMNQEGELTAAEVVNKYERGELKRIISKYGEKRWAGRIAYKIVEARKRERISTTGDLVTVIREAIPGRVQRASSIHPATKTFQALRIHVNGEMKNLQRGLDKAFDGLKIGGTMVFLSYHSLEDRRVKKFFNYKEKDCICPPELPVCRCDKEQEMEVLTSGAERPSVDEVANNPRARSARLRAGRRLQ